MSATERVLRLHREKDPARHSEGRATRTNPTGSGQQQGMILIVLLWVLAALSLLALNLSSTVRGELSVASASGQAEKAYFFARGGLETALYRLVYPSGDPEKQKARFPYHDGMNHFWITSGDWFCHVAVQDEAGKIDLNFANEAVLKRLLQKEIETTLGRKILAGDVPDGSRVVVDYDGYALTIRAEAIPVTAS